MRRYLIIVLFLLTSFTGFSQVSTFTSNVATGNWNAPGSWTEVGSDVDNIPDADDIVIILSGHNISLNGAQSASSVTINSGGTLTASGGGLTVGTMAVNGTYVHAIDGGTIPTSTWAANSNCIVTGITGTVPTGFSQSFGNLTWNSSGQTTNIYLQSNITIQGNFSVLDTGLPLDPTNRALRMSNTGTGYTINVAGDFNVTNSTFKLNNSTGSCTVNVNGNFNLNGGNVTIVTGNANSSISITGDVNILGGGTLEMQEDGSGSVGTLNVTGDFNHTSGTVTESGGGSGLIVFNQAGVQTFTSGGTITNTVNITVNSGTTLQTAAAGTVIGGNNFTLSSGASLGIRSTSGITSAGATGNIQSSGTRSFSTGATYIYNGSANQSAGNGLPGTVSNLTIANTGGGGNNTVTLVNNVGISNGLEVSSGVLALGANNITTVGSVSMTGTSITGTGTLTLAGNVTTVLSGTTASINAPIALGAASRTFMVPDGGADPDLAISSIISGAGGIIKNGAGAITISGANSFSGGSILNAGTLNLNNANALGAASGTFTINGGTIANTTGGTITLANYPQSWDGDFTFTGAQNLNLGAGLVTLGGNRQVTVNSSTLVISSVIGGGAFGITKAGGGVLALSGSNTFTGGVNINAGILLLTNPGALNIATPNAVTFGAGSTGTLRLNGNSVTISGLNTNAAVGTPIIETNAGGIAALTINSSGTNTFAGTLQNGGAGTLAIIKNGVGSLTLSGTNTYTGNTTLTAGALNINNASAIGSGTFNINGGTIDNTTGSPLTLSTNNPQIWNNDFTFTGTRNLNMGTGNVTLSTNIQATIAANTLTVGGTLSAASFNLTKAGAGTLIFGSNENHETWIARLWYGLNFLVRLPPSVALDMTVDIITYIITTNLALAQSVTPFLGLPVPSIRVCTAS